MRMPATDLGRGLLSLATFPVVFVVATLTGEGILAALGYESGDAVPAGLVVVVVVPLVVLLLAPLVLAWRFGRRAAAAGDRRGHWVAWPALFLAVWTAAANGIGLVAAL
jgi:hypothetical protein